MINQRIFRQLLHRGGHKLLSKLSLVSIPIILIAALTSSSTFAEYIRYHETSDSGVAYELIIEAETPEVMKPLPVKINVSRPDGSPAAEAHISCSLTMPAMAMPINKPPLKESGKTGQYKGVFLLTMGGLWNVELTSTFVSGEQDTVVIPIPGVITDAKKNSVDTKLEDMFHEDKAVKN
jgi:YtkA-like